MSVQRQIFEIEVQCSDLEEFSPERWTFGIDNLNALSVWEMLRALDKLKPAKRDEVMSAAKYVLGRRNWTGPLSRIEWVMKIVKEQRYTAPPTGMFAERPGFAEPAEAADAKVFIAEKTKGQGGQKGDYIQLAQPSMAVNAAGLSPSYTMKITRTIGSSTAISDVISDIAAQGALKHLIFNSHGFVKEGGATTLDLGTGMNSSSDDLFKKLDGKIGVIWICGCLAANSDSGAADCKARAKNAGAYLVAPAFLMSAGGVLAAGRMDMNARFLPHVFNPQGESIAWAAFLNMKDTLGFTTHFAH